MYSISVAQLVQRVRSAIVVAASMLAVTGCISDGPNLHHESESGAEGEPFESGTVGWSAGEYRLTMDGVRAWYSVVRELTVLSRADSSFQLELNFPLDSPVAPHIAEIKSTPTLSRVLQAQSLSPRDFINLTVLIGSGQIALQMQDSLGPAGRPRNIDPDLLTFFRQHREELEYLDSLVAAAGNEPPP